MSSLDRRQFLTLFAALPVTACGFTPVYGPGGTGAALRGSVEVDEPTDRASFLLVRDLEQALGRPTLPRYRLSVGLQTRAVGQAVTGTGEITRYNLIGEAAYALTRIEDLAVVAEGSVENFTGYSATGSTTDNLAAERDAHERLTRILADQIVARIVSTADLSA